MVTEADGVELVGLLSGALRTLLSAAISDDAAACFSVDLFDLWPLSIAAVATLFSACLSFGLTIGLSLTSLALSADGLVLHLSTAGTVTLSGTLSGTLSTLLFVSLG